MANNKARRAAKAKPVRLTRHAYRALRRAGISYKVTTGGRTTILGRGRAPIPIFPKARYKWLRKITY